MMRYGDRDMLLTKGKLHKQNNPQADIDLRVVIAL